MRTRLLLIILVFVGLSTHVQAGQPLQMLMFVLQDGRVMQNGGVIVRTTLLDLPAGPTVCRIEKEQMLSPVPEIRQYAISKAEFSGVWSQLQLLKSFEQPSTRPLVEADAITNYVFLTSEVSEHMPTVFLVPKDNVPAPIAKLIETIRAYEHKKE